MRKLAPALLLALAALLAGCSSISPDTYRAEQPRLDVFAYFNGTVDAWGQFEDRSGKVVKRFIVEIRGRVEGDRLTLDEDFRYSDGTTQKRVWTIERQPGGRYTGSAGDVVGPASGEAAGNALRWGYVLALEVDGRTWHVDFDDWMYLQDERVMLNRSVMSKFGIRLGEVIIAFRKRG
jgi:hypothetical protein